MPLREAFDNASSHPPNPPPPPSTPQQQIHAVIDTINKAVSRLTGLPSRWNGTVTIDNTSQYYGVKRWSCAIGINQQIVTTMKRYSTGTHEILHAHSVGLTDSQAYVKWIGYEEGVVEKTMRLLRDDVMVDFGYQPGSLNFDHYDAQNAYNGYIKLLEALRFLTGKSETDFYLELLKTPLSDREATIQAWIQQNGQYSTQVVQLFNALRKGTP